MTKTLAESAARAAPHIEVGLVCDPGSSLTGIHGMTDLFGYANGFARRRDPGCRTVRVSHWRLNAAASGVDCTYDSESGPIHDLRVLIIPGNRPATVEPVSDGPLIDWLRHQHAAGVVLGAVCGGVFILAKTGLLSGRQATTHWALQERFAAEFPDVLTETDHMVIDYGDIITAGGALAWADLGLRLTERLLGPRVMLDTARYLNIEPPGREQRFYGEFDEKTKHGDPAILKAQLWMATRREQNISIADVARHACLEQRTFLRRFVLATGMKPSEYQRRLRISRAREMLEFSRVSVEEVASSVGYNDVGGFRRIFRQLIGLTPSAYRSRFYRANNQPSAA